MTHSFLLTWMGWEHVISFRTLDLCRIKHTCTQKTLGWCEQREEDIIDGLLEGMDSHELSPAILVDKDHFQ
jgi:hypothetical protein